MAKKSKKSTTNGQGVKAKVIRLLKAGNGPTEAARKAGCSLTTARYHAKRIGMVKSNGSASPGKKKSVAVNSDPMVASLKEQRDLCAARLERLNTALAALESLQ
jgi:hypothetical protein